MLSFRIDRAVKTYHISMEKRDHRDPVPPIPELPSTVRKYFVNTSAVTYFILCYWGIYASYYIVFT